MCRLGSWEMGWVLGRQTGLSPKRCWVARVQSPIHPFQRPSLRSGSYVTLPFAAAENPKRGAGPQRIAVRGGVVSGVEGQRKRVVLAKRAASSNANGRGGVERRSITRGLVPRGRIVGLILRETIGESCSIPSLSAGNISPIREPIVSVVDYKQ